MPARLALFSVAMPDPSVTPLPTLFPLRVKSIVLPLRGETPSVNLADRLTVPPNVPVAGPTVSTDTTVLARQTVTSFRAGVTVPLLVVRVAWYFRYLSPLNCASDAPLLKNVPAVLSGPTKVNGPRMLVLAATWNLT